MHLIMTIVMTLRKMRTVLPSLKPAMEMSLRSSIVYKIKCPQCQLCYVGQKSRHLLIRFKKYLKLSAPVAKHLKQCNSSITTKDVEILHTTTRGITHLQTLEAL